MANIHDCLENLFADIADAIREKHGITDKLCADNFPNNIRAIRTASDGGSGITPTGTKTITTNGTHDVTSYAYAEVNVPTTGGDVVYGDDIEVGSLSELHSWEKYILGGTLTEESVTNITLFTKLASSSAIFEITYADSYEIVDDTLSLVNPTTAEIGSDNASRNAIKGKYIKTSESGNVYYIPSDARVAYGNYMMNKTIEVDKATRITYSGAEDQFVGIVVSEDSTAYPQNGTQGDYKYVYNGTLGDAGSNPVLQSKSVTPSVTEQTITPDTGYGGLSKVSVAGDGDLVAGNIRKGVEIFGVAGSYVGAGGSGGTDTTVDSGSAAAANHILKGKIAYVNGEEVVGTAENKMVILSDYSLTPQIKNSASTGQSTYIVYRLFPGKETMVRDEIELGANLKKFGDATAADVKAGKTFTSADGLKVVGTHECSGGGGFTVTDDGVGNVTITSSAITDNNGNVVIA